MQNYLNVGTLLLQIQFVAAWEKVRNCGLLLLDLLLKKDKHYKITWKEQKYLKWQNHKFTAIWMFNDAISIYVNIFIYSKWI